MLRLSFRHGGLSVLAFLLPSLPSLARAQAPQPEPTTAAASPESECFPACRTGYVCAHGTCVSRCNPPCGADEACTAQGECAAKPAPPALPAAPQEEWKSQRLFFRVGGGASYFDVATTTEIATYSSVYAENLECTALTPVGELAVGGVVARGLVVGGEVFGTSGTLKDTKGSGLDVKATYVQLGPFVDYFFLRHGGPHLMASTGYVVRESSGVWGVSAGAGYDFPIGGGWQLGGLLRFAFSPEMGDERQAMLGTLTMELSYR